MNKQKTLKIAHCMSICSFVFSTGCLSILAVLQSNTNWRFVISLTGYTAFILFPLISLYLCAIFRGVAKSQRSENEHPLTTSSYYLLFYNMSPLIGLVIGFVSAIGSSQLKHYALVTSTGSLMTTFLVWIIVDPFAGLFEMLLPFSRKHKQKRIAHNMAMRKKETMERKMALIEMEVMERHRKQQCESIVRMYTDVLVDIMATCDIEDAHTENIVVDIGVKAWQIGGKSGMKELHSAVIERYKQKFKDRKVVDCISIWWDGVGYWRNDSCEPLQVV